MTINIDPETPDSLTIWRVEKVTKGTGTHGCCACWAEITARKFKLLANVGDAIKHFWLCPKCWTKPPPELAPAISEFRHGGRYSDKVHKAVKQAKANVARDAACDQAQQLPKTCIIWRGLPGSGKTTVDELVRAWHDTKRDLEIRDYFDPANPASVTFCTDDYWWVLRCTNCNEYLGRVHVDAERELIYQHACREEWEAKRVYEFDYSLVKEANEWNRQRFHQAVDAGIPLVTMTNVNYARKFYDDYGDYASSKGYRVFVLTVGCSVEAALERQQHGVPEEVVRRFADSWELGVK